MSSRRSGPRLYNPGQAGGRAYDTIPLTRYAAFVRRHLVLLCMLPVLFGTGGLSLAILAPKSYVSKVNVLAPGIPLHVGELPGPDDKEARAPKPSTVDTEAQLVRSDQVIDRLRTAPGFRKIPPQQLRDRIGITVPPNTRVLEIAVAARTPRQAQTGAAIVADAYLNLRHQILAGVRQRNREALIRRRELLREQLKTFPAENASASQLTTRTRRQAVEKQLKEVRKQLSVIDDSDLRSGEIIRDATNPRRPEDRRRDIALSTGTGIGLLLALGTALLLDRRPRRVRKEDGIVLRTDVPVVGIVSPSEADRDGTCRRLRNLVFDEDARCVLLTGIPAEASMPVARELARLCATGGAMTKLLALQQGVTDGDAPTLRDFRESENYTRRSIQHAGGDRLLWKAVTQARAEADIVIVTGPDLGSVDVLTLATFCDMTIVVAEQETTIDVEVARGISELAEVAAPARALVLAEPADR